MKTSFALLFIFIVLVSCSKENVAPDNSLPDGVHNSLLKITPLKARIGDTISIEGPDLDKMTFRFNGTLGKVVQDGTARNKALVIVPTVHDERVMITVQKDISSKPIDSVAYNLVGFIPLKFLQAAYKDLTLVEAVSESIFYTVSGSNLYKTTNGGYDWALVLDFKSQVNAIHFINENEGWVITARSLFYTNNGGKSFKLSYDFPYDGMEVLMDVKFTSSDTGYLLTSKGSIYSNKNNIPFREIYRYPHSNRTSAGIEFYDLDASGNTIVTHVRSSDLIVGKDGVYSIKNYTELIGKVLFVGDQEMYFLKNGRLHLSNDSGQTWSKVSDNNLSDYQLLDNGTGIAVGYDDLYKPYYFMETRDGGVTWQHKRILKSYNESPTDMALYGNVGIVSGYRGLMWKYIRS